MTIVDFIKTRLLDTVHPYNFDCRMFRRLNFVCIWTLCVYKIQLIVRDLSLRRRLFSIPYFLWDHQVTCHIYVGDIFSSRKMFQNKCHQIPSDVTSKIIPILCLLSHKSFSFTLISDYQTRARIVWHCQNMTTSLDLFGCRSTICDIVQVFVYLQIIKGQCVKIYLSYICGNFQGKFQCEKFVFDFR